MKGIKRSTLVCMLFFFQEEFSQAICLDMSLFLSQAGMQHGLQVEVLASEFLDSTGYRYKLLN